MKEKIIRSISAMSTFAVEDPMKFSPKTMLTTAILVLAIGGAGQAAAATVFSVDVDLTAPFAGSTGSPGSFVRYDYNFDIAVGENELILDFGTKNLVLAGLDAVRAGFFPPVTNVSGQFSNEMGALIGPSFALAQSIDTLSNGNITGTDAGLDIVANDFHLFFTSATAGTFNGAVVFDVNDRGEGSIAIEDVSPVPLPAAFPLLVVALGGLGFVGRRRKAA